MNFTFKELIDSSTARVNKIDNMPKTDVVITNLMRLVVEVLQPLRDTLQQPVIITSGYRCKQLNDLVNGVSNSQHLTGQAVDIMVKGYTVSDLIKVIRQTDIPFDQLINEYNQWLHISLRESNNRKEILNYEKKKC